MVIPKIKLLIQDFLPPAMIRGLLSIMGKRNRWHGNYSTWHSAAQASCGYDSQVIFETARESARRVRDGKARWERDSVCFYHAEYNWQLVACLMTVAANSEGILHVLDFGGALGSTYMQHRDLLSGLKECTWSVVEQGLIVKAGQEEFASDSLGFFDTVENCLASRPVNVVLFSSVLQYIENPYSMLETVANLPGISIIIDRTPFAEQGERITVQHVPKVIYNASYPCRFLDRARTEAILKKQRTLTPWFVSPVDPDNFCGVLALSSRPA